MNDFTIYQLNDQADKSLFFEPFAQKIDPMNYAKVYEGKLDRLANYERLPKQVNEDRILDLLFEAFNVPSYMPREFEGHSLSVSDVIGLRKGALMDYYYVNDIGFVKLEGFGSRVVTDIIWDTDDDDLSETEKEEANSTLPSTVDVVEDAGEDEIMESLETEYGFLVNGCVVTQAV